MEVVEETKLLRITKANKYKLFYIDHLYAFYIDGNQRIGKPIYCEDAHYEDDIAENTSIGNLELYKGQRMLYRFDFGDECKFNVELMEVDKEASIPIKPIIVEVKGKTPEQYGEER